MAVVATNFLKNKNIHVNIKFSAHDTSLEQPSSGILKIKRLKIQIIQSFGSNKTKGPKQDSKNKVVSYHFTGHKPRQILVFIEDESLNNIGK
jgi:hypothetical protein